MKSSKKILTALGFAFLAATAAKAQLAWSAYNTSGVLVGTAGQAATFNAATGTYTFAVPVGQAYTFVTTNFAPISMVAPGSGRTVYPISYKMSASTGWTGVNASNRMMFVGIFNDNGTGTPSATNFSDDKGLWADIKGAGWGDEVFGGTTALANLIGSYNSSLKLGSGHVAGLNASWTLTDGELVDITFRPTTVAGGDLQIGNNSSSYANCGLLIQDDADVINGAAGFSFQTIYSSATANVLAPITMNEFAFYFYNTSNSITGDGAGSTATITVSAVTGLTPPPYFTAGTGEPPSVYVATLNDASDSLSCTVPSGAGLGTISYAWQYSSDGTTYTPIDTGANPSAATATLTLSDVQYSNAGYYEVVISNAAGSTTSTSTNFSVTASPVSPAINTPPQSDTVLVGGSETFSVSAYGTSPLAYQWYKSTDSGVSYNPISGATAATYKISTVALTDAGLYEVVVSNGVLPNATSAAATLTVNQTPSFTTTPTGANANPGDTVTLNSAATGTPAPTYQWQSSATNGTVWTNVSGATSASLVLSSITASQAAYYRVVATNAAGSATSSQIYVGVTSPTMTATTLAPSVGATGLNIDTPLAITFSQPVTAGQNGSISIIDVTDGNTVVDTINLANATIGLYVPSAPVYLPGNVPFITRNVGGITNGGNFNYYPIRCSGNTAIIYPDKVLAYGKTYAVEVTPNVFIGTDGSFAGISDTSTFTFSTKASATATSGSSLITVAADGSGDFNTVQSALDTANGTSAVKIYIKDGTYEEMNYVYGKNNVTLLGQDRNAVVIEYPDNNNFNSANTSTHGSYERGVFEAVACLNFTVANLSIRNTTPKNGTQAEALILNGNSTITAPAIPSAPTSTAAGIITSVSLYSLQDTLQVNGQAYISDSYIEGDVDFIWGTGPCYFTNCELKMLTSAGYYTQIRNGPVNTASGFGHGYVFVNCTLDSSTYSTGTSNPVTGAYLGRTDQTTGNGYPYSDVVYINCPMGTHIASVGWVLNGQSSAPNVNLAEYNSTQLGNGSLVDVSGRASFSLQITLPTNATELANDENAVFWLGSNWTPAMPLSIETQPTATQTVTAGQSATFSVGVVGVPDATFQWNKSTDGGTTFNPVSGATGATYTIATTQLSDAAIYQVVATNASGSVTSSNAALTVTDPFTTFASNYGLSGGDATLTANPSGDGISNMLKFLLGGDPTVSTPGILPTSTATTSGGQPAISYVFNEKTAALGTITPTVQYSSDLVSWTTAVNGVGGVSISTVVVDGATNQVTVTIPTGGTKLFVRLLATHP